MRCTSCVARAAAAKLTPEQLSENGRQGGRTTVERGLGIHELTPEQRSENGRQGGRAAQAKLTPEQRSEKGRENGPQGGRATQALYDRDPEAWARNKRARREAGLQKAREGAERRREERRRQGFVPDEQIRASLSALLLDVERKAMPREVVA